VKLHARSKQKRGITGRSLASKSVVMGRKLAAFTIRPTRPLHASHGSKLPARYVGEYTTIACRRRVAHRQHLPKKLRPAFAHCASTIDPKISPSHAWLCSMVQVEPLEALIMNPRRFPTVGAALCATVVLRFGSSPSFLSSVRPASRGPAQCHRGRRAPSLAANAEPATPPRRPQ